MRPSLRMTPAFRRRPRSGHQSLLALSASGREELIAGIGLGTGVGGTDGSGACRFEGGGGAFPFFHDLTS